MLLKSSLYIQSLLALLVLSATAESCWNNNQDCIIDYEFRLNDLQLESSKFFNLSCDTQDNSIFQPLLSESLPYVTINGCHTSFWGSNITSSYGLGMIPHCTELLSLTLEHFYDDELQQLNCESNETLHLEILNLRHNDVGILTAAAFVYLNKLNELKLEFNSLRHMERNIFADFSSLQKILIQQEPLLALKQEEAAIFKQSNLKKIKLKNLKMLTAELLTNLPKSLIELHVAQTPFENANVVLINAEQLQKVDIVFCSLKSFELRDEYETLFELNLSGNALTAFEVKTNSLLTLDLSYNELGSLPLNWLKDLKNLQYLSLSHNKFKSLSLADLIALPSHHIDLRENQLIALRDASVRTNVQFEYLKTLQIDKNPWNCMWLLDFAHGYPEKFRIFQYEKFISQINVNGLTCQPQESENVSSVPKQDESLHASNQSDQQQRTTAAPQIINASLYTMNPGWDFKRSQRDEALIIVFMLPLGIAFLFLLLYMWIYCQKMFHWSYYSNLPLIGSNHRHPHTSADRVDVVRQIPPQMNGGICNGNDDYEMPLNGVASECNCHCGTAAGGEATGDDIKCRKKLHVTYEPLPDDPAYKIYEEILGGEESKIVMEDGMPHPFYDHLNYVQKPVDQNK